MKKHFLLIATLMLYVLAGAVEFAAAKPQVPGYQLRIAAYQDLKKAQEHDKTLKESGADSYIEKVTLKNKGTWYRINVGRFKNRSEAEAAGRKLKEGGVLTTYALQPAAGGTPVSVSDDETAPVAKGNKGDEAKPVGKKPVTAGLEKEKPPAVAAPSVVHKPEDKPAAQALKTVPVTTTAAAVASASAPVHSPSSGAAGQAAPPTAASPAKGGSLYDQAVTAFNAGKYEDALAKFLDVNKANPEPAIKEKVLRYIADSYYAIGAKGGNRELLSAVDAYKELIQKYPESRKENAGSVYNLARSYEQLKFFYEAKREYQKLYSQFPESPHRAEALFRTGDMSYRTRNFNEAIMRFKEYLAQFPQGALAQRAYFGIGDAYSQLQQIDQADTWYGDAQKRWSLEAMPEESILNLGYHYFRSHKYPDAVRVLFFYVNMYPETDATRESLFSIARSFVEMQQHAPAIRMFSLLIERFPDSRESQESAVIMANIGVRSPNLKLPDIPGIQNYREPLKVYNRMLAQTGMSEMTEGLLFQKGYALWKYGRYEEAFDTFSTMIQLFSQGRYKEEGIKNLIMNINQLVELHSSRDDSLAIARIFFKTPSDVLSKNADTQVILRIGDALYKVGLLFDAKRVFENLLKILPAGSDASPILVALADIESQRGRYDEAERLLQAIPAKGRADRKLSAGMQVLRGNIALRRGFYAKAAAAYADALATGEQPMSPAVFYRNYAAALKETNACSQAIVNYDKAVALYLQAGKGPPYYAEEVLVTSYQGMGECYLREGKYPEAALVYKKSMIGAADRRENLWALYDMGKGYVQGNNRSMAEKFFTDLKGKGGEEFWGNIIDYTIKEKAWTEKYAKYLR